MSCESTRVKGVRGLEQGATVGVVAVAVATPHFWFIIARGGTATLEISGYVMKRIFISQKTLFYKTFVSVIELLKYS